MTEALKTRYPKDVQQDGPFPTAVYSICEMIRRPIPWHKRLLFTNRQAKKDLENEPRRIRLMGINSMSRAGGVRQFLLQIDIYPDGKVSVYNPGFGIPEGYRLRDIELSDKQKKTFLALWVPVLEAQRAQKESARMAYELVKGANLLRAFT